MGNSRVVTETADRIKDMERDAFRRFDGRRYSTVAVIPNTGSGADLFGVREDGVAFGRFPVTGLIVGLVQTGQTVDRNGLVRARMVRADDTGDLAGTLRFDFAEATPVKVQQRVFRQDGLY